MAFRSEGFNKFLCSEIQNLRRINTYKFRNILRNIQDHLLSLFSTMFRPYTRHTFVISRQNDSISFLYFHSKPPYAGWKDRNIQYGIFNDDSRVYVSIKYLITELRQKVIMFRKEFSILVIISLTIITLLYHFHSCLHVKSIFLHQE